MTQQAVVVGAGHNGLVAAGYLAKAGVKVLVLERRELVGGAAVTEEVLPGFKVSTASYSLSLLRPDVHRDLQLFRHGLTFSAKDPQMFVPLSGGRSFFVWRDCARTIEELARIHPPDAEAYPRWLAFWEGATSCLRPLVEDPDPPRLAEVEAALARRGRSDIFRLAVAGSAEDVVSAFFRSEEIRGAFASQGIIGTAAGPREPGTAWVLAYHQLGGELNGAGGTWAYVHGGMGAVTRALASAAKDLGVEIRTGAEVEEILVDHGRAVGVRLVDGSQLRACVILSNADPKATFLRMAPPGLLDAAFIDRVQAWRTDGPVAKVNLALAELPDFSARPGPGPQHRGTIEISPSIDYLEQAYEDGRRLSFSSRPFMEVFIQSATDPTLAPEGRHVLSAFAQYAGSDVHRAQALDAVLTTIAAHAPNVPDAVLGAEVLLPEDLEERFGLTGGDIFHGSMLPEQCFGERFSYRTPLPGLYLCGSGSSPGGGVMGAAGRNAARVVLADLGQPDS